MPELPEVQALVGDLRGRVVGRRVARLELVSFAALKTFDPPASALDGRLISGVERHGKFLDLVCAPPPETPDAGELHLTIHLARAGWLRWRAQAPAARTRPGAGPLAARLVLAPDDADPVAHPGGDGFDLTEAGTKKGLAISVVRSPDDVPHIAGLGPDPLADAFDEAAFQAVLAGAGRAQIKGVLRDQRRIAGIGNAYSDEILHAARMSPYAPASMGPDDVHRLYTAMRATLTAALERADGLAASELKAEKKTNLQVHGRFKLPCPVCGDTVQQVIHADSTFQYCPTCQTGGKKLSDRVMDRLLK